MRSKKELLALSDDEIRAFGATLTTTNPLDFVQSDIDKITAFVCSDGCTGVPDFYRWACVVHDFFYRTHRDFNGNAITKAQADKWFRVLIQQKSLFKLFNPMSWWRWLGVKYFPQAQKAWDD
jgi:hypothetical protein